MKGGALLDFLFPQPCVGCGKFVHKKSQVYKNWCIHCDAHRKKSGPYVTHVAGITVISAHSFDDSCVRNALHALKYQRLTDLGMLCGQWLVERTATKLHEKIILVPIPLTEQRLALRGFNQAAAIAHGVSRAAGSRLQVNEHILFRIKGSGQQAHRTREARMAALRGTFEARAVHAGATYCIVDDVITTGSTMAEAARALRCAGAQKIIGMTVAAD